MQPTTQQDGTNMHRYQSKNIWRITNIRPCLCAVCAGIGGNCRHIAFATTFVWHAPVSLQSLAYSSTQHALPMLTATACYPRHAIRHQRRQPHVFSLTELHCDLPKAVLLTVRRRFRIAHSAVQESERGHVQIKHDLYLIVRTAPRICTALWRNGKSQWYNLRPIRRPAFKTKRLRKQR
jgi:hypothetical protein